MRFHEPDKRRDHFSQHFRERLQERYGIDITDEQYFSYCDKEIDLIYKINSNKRFGTLEIEGRKIYVVKCKESKLLNTCFPDDGSLPLPTVYRHTGSNKEAFESDLETAQTRITTLIKWLEDNYKTPEDQKKFFVDKPYGFELWEYGAAWKKYRNKQPKDWFGKLIKKVGRRQLKNKQNNNGLI